MAEECNALSTVHKAVEFFQSNLKYNILIEYDINQCSLSLTFTTTDEFSAVYTESFNEQNIQTITNKCSLHSKHLYELLSLKLSCSESINECFRIYKDSDIQSLINKYTQFNKMSDIPEPTPESSVENIHNASISTNYSYSDSNELPLGWAKLKDDDGFYYFNVITSNTQRNRPTITTHSEEKLNETESDTPQTNYLLFVFHFTASKYVQCNYCFILKQKQLNMDNTSTPILPPFLSIYKFQNRELLKIIHLIENMRIPHCAFDSVNEYNKAIISSMIAEFPNTFREILYLTQRRHLSTIDSGYDPRKNSSKNNLSINDHYGMSARSRRVAITKDEQRRKETVPPPSDLEMNILNEPVDKFIPNFSNIKAINKKVHLKFQLNYKDIAIDTDSYKHIEYSQSALIYDDEQKTNALLSILKEIDILNQSEDVFTSFDWINNVNYFDFMLRIIYNLPFGMKVHKEKLLMMLLQSASTEEKSHVLQQKLLFLYWSFAKNGDKGLNYMESDLYLSNDYASMILLSLSRIINKQSVFILDSTKCWKRMIKNITTYSMSNEIKFDNFDSAIRNANIPSQIVLPLINISNMEYNNILSHFFIDCIMYNNIYQYKNCNVYDIFCSIYHSNREKENEKKFQSTLLLRIGIQCKLSQTTQFIFDLVNGIWSKYKFKYQFEYDRNSINDDHENEIKIAEHKTETVSLNNKILYLGCESITKCIGIWKIKGDLVHCASISSLYEVLQQRLKYFHDITSFTNQFIVASSTIFVTSYILGLDWHEILEITFIHQQYGDVYLLSPLSILLNCGIYKKSFTETINDMDEKKDDNQSGDKNVFILHVYKLLKSLQNKNNNEQSKDLWSIWKLQVQRLFNIIMFNQDEHEMNKLEKDKFDHSNLYQIMRITKLLYCTTYDNSAILQSYDITQHFVHLIRLETHYYVNNMK